MIFEKPEVLLVMDSGGDDGGAGLVTAGDLFENRQWRGATEKEVPLMEKSDGVVCGGGGK